MEKKSGAGAAKKFGGSPALAWKQVFNSMGIGSKCFFPNLYFPRLHFCSVSNLYTLIVCPDKRITIIYFITSFGIFFYFILDNFGWGTGGVFNPVGSFISGNQFSVSF